MKYKAVNILLLLGVFLFSVRLATAQDFSADLVTKGGKQASKGKIFYAKEKIRMENEGAISITRLDKKIIWMLMPKENMYMEMPLQPQNMVAGAEKVEGEVERKFLGKEAVDGKMADKYRIVSVSGSKRAVVLTWLADGLNIPIKTTAEDGSWSMEYKNIQIGKQPDSLFEIPPGYQKFSYSMPSLSNMKKALTQEAE